MANWVVDPCPFVPTGFTLVDRCDRPPIRMEVYITGCYTKHNEDLAIVRLEPPVDKADFPLLETALREYFLNTHNVHVGEISPCLLGDAYICFNTALEREKFLGPVFRFRNAYNMYLIKHDEVDNAWSFDLDREVWVLLLGFPDDLKCDSIVANTVSCFGKLEDWFCVYEPGKVVAKVYLNDDAKVPDNVKINAGLPIKGKSWSVAVYLLKKNSLNLPQDEEAYVTFSPLHPVPPPAPRWIGGGPAGNASGSNPGSGGGTAMNTDAPVYQTRVAAKDRWMMVQAPVSEVVTPNTLIPSNLPTRSVPSRLRSVIVGPSAASDLVIPIIPTLVRQNFGENALQKLALDYPDKNLEAEEEDATVEVLSAEGTTGGATPPSLELVTTTQDPSSAMEISDDSDLELLAEAPSSFKTPIGRKKKTSNVEDTHESSFFRRSKCLADKSGGFKSAADAKAHQEFSGGSIGEGPSGSKKPKAKREPKKKKANSSIQIEEVEPLSMIAPDELPAPHLPRAVLVALELATSRYSLRLCLPTCWKLIT